jgi:aminoglycoside phosphotransferase (APT) family kinase protein
MIHKNYLERSMPELSLQTFLPRARAYLLQAEDVHVPTWSPEEDFSLEPLAQGEYNMNFLVKQGHAVWVLRINTGSQINLTSADQIEYEYKTLELLEPAGVTPKPYFMDNSMTLLPYGILGMEFVPGETLDYHRDLCKAARVMAQYHQLAIPEESRHLIHEANPLSLTYDRCEKMLQVYFDSELADSQLRKYLLEVRSWANEARYHEQYFINDPWNCVINTEVNNTNWIVNRKYKTTHLVDWEKPLRGDPSQDLSHFRVPTTTLWKTDYLMSEEDKKLMMSTYKENITDLHLRDTIEDRTRLRDPFNCLRGVSWCAMAWIQYQSDDHLLKNKDTFNKLSMYIDMRFVRSLFDPFLST